MHIKVLSFDMDYAEFDDIYRDVVDNHELAYFHFFDSRTQEPTSVFDSNIHVYLCKTEHIFFINETPYVYDSKQGIYIRDKDGSILKTLIKGLIYPEKQKAPTIKRVYDLFVSDSHLKKSIEDLNNYPKSWICFANDMYDAKTRQFHKHDPKYLAINQIPHWYNPDKITECPKIDSWLDEIMGQQDREMFLEYAGLCLTADTSQQKFLMFTGEGGTGKSLALRLITTMAGPKNIASTDLKSLADNRYAKANLFQKLVNCCADIDSTSLESTASIKLLTGEDPIDCEPKHKMAITFVNYAKLLFSANEVPRIKAEHTNAFYRRLLVIRLNKKPKTVNADFFQELTTEMEGFIALCMEALYKMYSRGTILESENSKRETQKLRLFSDSVEAFLVENTTKKKESKIPGKDLYIAYKKYCEENELSQVQKTTFFKACEDKGYSHSDGRNFKGLEWKSGEFISDSANESPDEWNP